MINFDWLVYLASISTLVIDMDIVITIVLIVLTPIDTDFRQFHLECCCYSS